MGAPLVNRKLAITVGDTVITGLRMAFKITRSLKPEPNSAEITIYNLTKDQRSKFQAAAQDVAVDAGYAGLSGLIYKGELQICTSTAQGPDWVTTLKTADGGKGYRTARINESLGAGTSIIDAMKKLAKSLGVGMGDAETRISAAKMRQGLTQFVNGAVLSGMSRDILDNLLRAHGIEWSIQSGELQLLPKGKSTNESAILLTPASGLIGSPEVGEFGSTKADKKIMVKCTALLQHGFTPGRNIDLRTAYIKPGLYRIEKVTHSGDTHDTTWYSEFEAVPAK